MDFKTDAKTTCPQCGDQTKKGTMNEEGVNYSVQVCSGCGWWG